MILILSTIRDEHAQYVMAELLKSGKQAHLMDLSEFPRQLRLSMLYRNNEHRFAFGCEEKGLSLEDCGSIWWRRPQQPVVSKDIKRDSYREFAMNETAEALQGLWQSVGSFWINNPVRDNIAQRKAYQLRIAQSIGLEIPATLITSCPWSAREFVAEKGIGNVIYKSFSATEAEWRETRILKKDELQLLENVKYAPVIFQEYIEATVDLRITIVDKEIFAAAIHSQDSSYKADFRIDMENVRVEGIKLPDDIEEKLHRYMDKLGLVFGAVDMRLTPGGRYVFLEINPAGQWLFIEQKTGQKITETLARTLIKHDGN